MGSVVIVGVEEPVERSGAGVVGPVGPDVGPFLEQGAVEPFDLAVRLWPAGAGFARASRRGPRGSGGR